MTTEDPGNAELDALMTAVSSEMLEAIKGAAAPDFEALIEASSLGTPAAKALRAEGGRMLYGDNPPDMDRIHATGEDLTAGRITAAEAYERFLQAGCLPAGARLHLRLRD